MPLVPFDTLPPDARVWVFGSDRPLGATAVDRLLAHVDHYLAGWSAHGAPLTVGRNWRDDHFLTVAVDQRDANASGCSIDGLFRALREIESVIGGALTTGGRVYYRRPDGAAAGTTRDAFIEMATAGTVREDTIVFDPTVHTLGEWRARFETTAGQAWHGALLPVAG